MGIEKGHIRGRPALAQASLFLLFLSLALVAYYSILNNTFIDDDFSHAYKVGQLKITEIWRTSMLLHNFVRPAPLMTLWVQYRLFGFTGWPSHLINIAFHAFNAYLLYWLLFRLGARRLTALAAALLFVLTPIGPEAVTWSSGRYDLMSLMFVLLAMGLYWSSIVKQSKNVFIASMVAVVLALLSKENAMILAVLLPAIEILYGRKRFKIVESIIGDQEELQQPTATQPAYYGPVVRLSIFFFFIAGSIVLHYAILGRFGGYENSRLFSGPWPPSMLTSMSTVISPLSSYEFSGTLILLLAIYTGMICAAALAVVLLRWRLTGKEVKRLFILIAAFLLVSLAPIYQLFFSVGLTHRLEWSRLLYTVTAAFLALLVVGLLEFGWQKNRYQAIATLALLVLLPIYFIGVNYNNRPWEKAAAINYSIPLQAQSLLPLPPPNTTLILSERTPLA